MKGKCKLKAPQITHCQVTIILLFWGFAFHTRLCLHLYKKHGQSDHRAQESGSQAAQAEILLSAPLPTPLVGTLDEAPLPGTARSGLTFPREEGPAPSSQEEGTGGGLSLVITQHGTDGPGTFLVTDYKTTFISTHTDLCSTALNSTMAVPHYTDIPELVICCLTFRCIIFFQYQEKTRTSFHRISRYMLSILWGLLFNVTSPFKPAFLSQGCKKIKVIFNHGTIINT